MALLVQRKLPALDVREDLRAAQQNGWSGISADGRFGLFALNGFAPTIVDLANGTQRVAGADTKYIEWMHVGASGWATLVEDRRGHYAVRTIDLASGKSKQFRSKDELRRAFVLEPGLVLALQSGEAVFLESAKGERVGPALPARVDELAVSAQGVIATTAYGEATSVSLWSNRKVVAKVPALGKDGAQVFHMAFSPDGTRLGFFDDDVLRVVDTATGASVFVLKETGLPANVIGAALSSNERSIVLATADRTLTPRSQVTVFSIDFGARGAKFATEATLAELDGHPAVGPHGILVNRQLLLAIAGAESAPPAKAEKPKAEKSKAEKPKAEKPKAEKPKAARATLHLGAAQLKSLRDDCEEALALLQEHVDVAAFDGKSEARATAEKAAKALDGVMVASDIDWDFAACTLTGADPKGERVEVTKPSKKYGTERLLSDVPDATPETLDEYVSEGDQKSYKKAAALLDAGGSVRQLRLTGSKDDGYTVVLTLAGPAGVLTVRSDT
ncbi:MAG: hypothetical protein HOO96_21945 [Polyangiaceae bacterium]|nr:hypothetical protein [Polyangiaceae bacterium]